MSMPRMNVGNSATSNIGPSNGTLIYVGKLAAILKAPSCLDHSSPGPLDQFYNLVCAAKKRCPAK